MIGGLLVVLTLVAGCELGPFSTGAGDTTDATVAASQGRWIKVPAPRKLIHRDQKPGQLNGPHAVVPVQAGDRVVVIAGVDYDGATVKGFVFDLVTRRSWRTAPSGLWWRTGQSAVAAGDRVIIWGGCCGPGGRGIRAPGAIYDASRDRWIPRQGPFGDRYDHTAVWTGKEMIIWGGFEPAERPRDPHEQLRFNELFQADGAAYDPRADRWRMIAPAPLSPRGFPAAVWTGKEMIIWGGSRPAGPRYARLLYDGAAYDPERNRWRRLARTRFLSACVPAWRPKPCGTSALRSRVPYTNDLETDLHAAWTGRAMVVWSSNRYVAAGALYDPDRDRWERIARPPPEIPIAPTSASAIWTGEELIVWGGIGETADTYVTEGAAYDPAEKQWAALPQAPSDRGGQIVIGTGEGMLVWGGDARDGAIFVPE